MRALLCAALVVMATTAPSATAISPGIDICYATASPPTNATQFTCAGGATGSMVELGAIGYEVVNLTAVAGPGGVVQRLIVQRSVTVMSNGFEG